MYHPTGQPPLARLRPEKLDDAEIQKQISLVHIFRSTINTENEQNFI